MNNNRDKLTQVLQQISAYRKGDLSLQILINDLEFLHQEININDNEWDNKYKINWEALEEAYAVSLDEEINEASKDIKIKNIIDNALDNILALVRKHL